MKKDCQIQKSLQILLWLWFGTITSFTAVNVVNIVKLETKIDMIKISPQLIYEKKYYKIN